MKVGSLSSTESRQCVVCGKKTANYKTYEQTSIEIKIPLCDTDERRCFSKVDISDTANTVIRLIKKEIRKGE